MDQVVCIRDDWGHKGWIKTWPVVGGIYTIREALYRKAVRSLPPILFYRFEEIVNPLIITTEPPAEPVFEASWFRPVRRTSIEVLTQITTVKPQEVEPV